MDREKLYDSVITVFCLGGYEAIVGYGHSSVWAGIVTDLSKDFQVEFEVIEKILLKGVKEGKISNLGIWKIAGKNIPRQIGLMSDRMYNISDL